MYHAKTTLDSFKNNFIRVGEIIIDMFSYSSKRTIEIKLQVIFPLSDIDTEHLRTAGM